MAAIAATSNYYQDNKDALRERAYKWRQEHPERHKAAKSEAYKRERIYYIEQDNARYRRIRATFCNPRQSMHGADSPIFGRCRSIM